MSRTRAALAATTLAATTLAGLTGLGAVTGASASGAAAAESTRGVPEHQRITFTADSCARCSIGLISADRRYEDVWESADKIVGRDGRVTFRVPQAYVGGVLATIDAPWEDGLGYVSHVVFRYAGERTGSSVTVAEARDKSRGSLCLRSDPTDTRSTVALTVRKVRVGGAAGRVDGTLAFADRTRRRGPMTQVWDGVGGAQDVVACR